MCLCPSLQEVSATPVRYITDLISEDSWSHLLMDTLAPMGYIKVPYKQKNWLCVSAFNTVEYPYICLYAVVNVTKEQRDKIRMSRLLIKLVKLHCSLQAIENTRGIVSHQHICVP